ncbi:hypothetical protein [Pantoea sp. B65]|uniref:hypothetical protein n=1 Tax=Pantoea sp. B65 TaxID=2813359 RepID=UPI0039B3F98F
MYDDMSSLSEKLQISSFSFQEIMKEKKNTEKTQDISATPLQEVSKAAAISDESTTDDARQHTADYRKPATSGAGQLPASNNDNNFFPNAPTGGELSRNNILSSVAGMLEKSPQVQNEKQPVRLDMLFSMIAQKRF